MTIGILSDSNASVFYSPEGKMVTVADVSIIGVDTVEAAIAKCQHLFLGFIENPSDDEVLIREESYSDEWYQPPFECVSCGCTFMMDDEDLNFCPGCGKRVSHVIKGRKDNEQNRT